MLQLPKEMAFPEEYEEADFRLFSVYLKQKYLSTLFKVKIVFDCKNYYQMFPK